MTRVYVLALFYGTEHLDSCLRELTRCFGADLRMGSNRLVAVQNKLDVHVEGLIPGNNSDLEFSGWQTGWEYLQARGVEDRDAVVIVNDSFHRNYDASIWRDDYEWAFSERRVVGWRGVLPTGVSFEGNAQMAYFRTNCFVVSAGDLRRAGGFLPPARIESPLSDSRLDRGYRDYLVSWLTGENQGATSLKHFWYRAEPLTPESDQRLQAKARSIYYEHHLSYRLWLAGVQPVWIQDQPGFRRRWNRYRRWKRFFPVQKPGGARWHE